MRADHAILFACLVCLGHPAVVYSQGTGRQVLNPRSLPPPRGYSHAVVAPAGRRVSVSGQVAVDSLGNVVGPADFRAQSVQVFENLDRALRSAGATFADVVSTNMYVTDLSHLAVLRDVRARYLPADSPPASTLVQVVALYRPELMIEISAEAVVPEHGKSALAREDGTGGTCIPVAERAGREFGCFIVATANIGRLGTVPVFWHLTTFATRATATAAGARGTLVESFGKTWLLTIAQSGWRATGGSHIAEIGPLPVGAGRAYAARYMEAVFLPGMKSRVHRHPGPEAWYTLTGEMCLETPGGSMVGRAGGSPVIVPGGPPMELAATGTGVRRSLALVLHDVSQPASTPASDWTPRGLCESAEAR
ncbi:MAG: RidA family protein [Gemmatimonadales bacterium]|nr:RidA family protein [Gemmatimonadales bacterium]